MKFLVMVEKEGEGYRATPLVLPDAAVVAPTRDAAVRVVTEALAALIERGELVEIQIPDCGKVPLVSS